jgi:hypothetical protein
MSRPNLRDGSPNIRLPGSPIRHEPGNRPPVAGDDDGLAALDLVEQARQLSLSVGSVNFGRHVVPP